MEEISISCMEARGHSPGNQKNELEHLSARAGNVRRTCHRSSWHAQCQADRQNTSRLSACLDAQTDGGWGILGSTLHRLRCLLHDSDWIQGGSGMVSGSAWPGALCALAGVEPAA